MGPTSTSASHPAFSCTQCQQCMKMDIVHVQECGCNCAGVHSKAVGAAREQAKSLHPQTFSTTQDMQHLWDRICALGTGISDPLHSPDLAPHSFSFLLTHSDVLLLSHSSTSLTITLVSLLLTHSYPSCLTTPYSSCCLTLRSSLSLTHFE
jgi:hypothetical protein